MLIIQIVAMFFKVPLEAHEAKDLETNERRSDPTKKKVTKVTDFLLLGGPKDGFSRNINKQIDFASRFPPRRKSFKTLYFVGFALYGSHILLS